MELFEFLWFVWQTEHWRLVRFALRWLDLGCQVAGQNWLMSHALVIAYVLEAPEGRVTWWLVFFRLFTPCFGLRLRLWFALALVFFHLLNLLATKTSFGAQGHREVKGVTSLVYLGRLGIALLWKLLSRWLWLMKLLALSSTVMHIHVESLFLN